MLTNEVVRVHRSKIFELPFSTKDMLEEEGDRVIRRTQLEKAMKLGNDYRQAVKIQFQTSDGVVGETDATVWSLTEDKVELKGGKIIPIGAILSVAV